MKINKLQVINFQGLSGKREFLFPDRVSALALPNGSGKTSVFNAIRYGLTGEAPKGYFVTSGAEKTDVGLIFADGTHVVREGRVKGSGRFWYQKKAVRKEDLDAAIAASCGVPVSTVHLTTSADLVANMKPQELSDFMLSFLPETYDVEKVASYVPGITPGIRQKMEAGLPAGEFGVGELDRFYSAAYDKRRDTGRTRTECQGVIRAFGNPAVPDTPLEELKKKREEIMAAIRSRDVYKTALAAYQRAKAQAEQQKVVIDRLKKQLDEAKAAQPKAPEPGRQEAIQKQIQEKQAELDEAKKVSTALSANVTVMEKTLLDLAKPVCPISQKLICTTDKTPIRAELEQAIAATKNGITAQQGVIRRIMDALAALNAEARADEAARAAWVKQSDLASQLAQAEAMKVALPPEPQVPPTRDLDGELAAVDAGIRQHEAVQKVASARSSLAQAETEYADWNAIVNAFAPKGPVREAITSAYLTAFEDSCNQKAEEIRPGMRMKFVSSNGLIPMLDVNGNGNFLAYPALSGGERILLLFLLLDMFNSMSGLRILILDELSVLDKENFASLLSLIQKHTDEYDQVILSMAAHDDLMEVLRANGISCLTIGPDGGTASVPEPPAKPAEKKPRRRKAAAVQDAAPAPEAQEAPKAEDKPAEDTANR